MTEPFDDADLHSRLSVLDGEVDPNPAFAERLERQLLAAMATPEHTEGPAVEAPTDTDRPLEIVARDRFQPRWAWAAAAVILLAAGLGVAGVRPDGRQQTITGPGDEQRTEPTADRSNGHSAPDSVASTTEPDRRQPDEDGRVLGRSSVTDLAGILPDGTSYQIHVEPGVAPTVATINAGIVVELADGRRPPIGAVSFEQTGQQETAVGFTADGGEFRAASGGWTMRIELDAEVVVDLAAIAGERFGDDDTERLLVESIRPLTGGSMPRFELAAPLHWEADGELSAAMEVTYADLVVRRGCGSSSVACSGRRGVQLVLPDPAAATAPALVDRQWWIDSIAPRPPGDESWLDPGPLEPRGGHQVLWTGREMIVWGGATGDRPAHLVDGAAFDPASNRWRLLAPAPIEAPAYTAALWAGDEMLVLSLEATFAYDPSTDSWQEVGEGVIPGKPIWTGSEVATVNREGAHRFDRRSGRWTELGDLNTGGLNGDGLNGDGAVQQPLDYWYGATLQSIDGALFSRRGCSAVVRRWDGSDWQQIDPLPPSIDTTGYHLCPWANQWTVVDDKILLWESENHPTVVYDPASGSWSEVERIPLPSTEGPGGTVEMGDRILATTWKSAIYEPASGVWQEVELPGRGFGVDVVWTGDELLMWGGACCYGSSDTRFTIDAWRWTPPAPAG